MADDDIWTDEEMLWTGGPDAWRGRMAPGCLMAFAGVGIMQGETIIDAISQAPRWQSVEMSARHSAETDDLCIIAYRAVAHREGEDEYRALCTSTWRREGTGWRLHQHQQTAIAE